MGEYKSLVEQNIENTKKCVQYPGQIEENLDKQTYIAKLVENNQALHLMLQKNTQLLDYLFFSRKDIYAMSDEDYHYLQYFVDQVIKELPDLDSNLIFEIYTVLLHYAHLNLSVDEQIENEYFVSYYTYSTQLNLIPYFKSIYKAYNSINYDSYFKLPIVKLNHRKLTDCEFAQIKLHSELEISLVKILNSTLT